MANGTGRHIFTKDDWKATDPVYTVRSNDASHETIGVTAPVVFFDDFLGDSISVLWTTTATNSTTALVATQPHGVCAFTHDATDEAQTSELDFGDVVCFDPNKALVAEFRVNLALAPTVLNEMYFGLTSDNDVASESKDIHASFAFDGSSALLVSADDGSTDGAAAATGHTGADGTWFICKIDMTTLSAVTFSVNGSIVSTLDMSNINATDYLQPYIICYKASGVGVGTLEVDYVKIWSKR